MYIFVPVNDVLIVDGLQLPLIPFIDVADNTGAFEPWHSVPIAAKDGVTFVVMLNDLLPVDLHPPLAVTVIPKVTVPVEPTVYLIAAVPAPDVIVPLLIVQA